MLKLFFSQVYRLIPFKQSFFRALKYFYVPPPSIYKHLHFKGIIRVKINEKSSFKMHHLGYIEENEIFWKGLYSGWEKLSITFWVDLCKTANTICDIGANTGLYGLVAQTISPNAKVFCFEPIPGVFAVLKKNTEINNLHIFSSEIALSNYNGEGKIYLNAKSDFAYSVTVNKNTVDSTKTSKEVKINVARLDSFIEKNNIEKIDLMKIDVETHEVEVLEGMGKYLELYKPTIIIEVLNENIADKLNSIFNEMDYLYFNIDDLNNSVRQTKKIKKSDYWNYLLCNREIAKNMNLI